jgi:thiol-disulfide isomerase/thioredoxin
MVSSMFCFPKSRARILSLTLAAFWAMAFLTDSLAQEAAPALEMTDHTGQLQRLEDYRGKVVVLNFWATWCGPCAAEMPIFVDAQKRYGKQGVVVLAASLDDDETKANIPEFMRKRKMNFPVLMGATVDHLELFSLGQALPATVFIDPVGNVFSRILGEAKKGDVRDRVEWLLGRRKGKEPVALLDNIPEL